MSAPWRATLSDGRIGVRPLRTSDAATWRRLRIANDAWLTPWEATVPGPRERIVPEAPWPGGRFAPLHRAWSGERQDERGYVGAIRQLRREARAGLTMPFVVTVDGAFAGQITVGSITRGSAESANLGYWVDRAHAGQGVIPTALALVVDHCFYVAGLHRVEANIRPENAASRRVVEKLGFHEEGLRRRSLHISGGWRDHLCYALTVEDVGPDRGYGVLARWHATRGAPPH